jgi:hypothetical protein
MIFEILEKSKTTKQLISLHCYGDDGKFFCGYVQHYDETNIVFNHYTKFGKLDGIVIESISNIEQIEYENEYLNCIQYLIDNTETLNGDRFPPIVTSSADNWCATLLEEYVGRKDCIFSLKVSGDNFATGFILWCDNEYVAINKLDYIGNLEGKCIYKIEDISSVRINDLEDMRSLRLYEWRLKTRNK